MPVMPSSHDFVEGHGNLLAGTAKILFISHFVTDASASGSSSVSTVGSV